MALTKETILSNEVLNGLTEDQIGAIETLSNNDEEVVINTKIGEQHGRLEEDILAITGEEKQQGEKSYQYAKRVLEKYKTVAEGSKQIDEQKYLKRIKDLELQVKNGISDEQTLKKLKDAEDNIKALEEKYKTDEADWQKLLSEKDSNLKKIRLDNAFSRALSNIKLKSGYSESVKDMLIESAKNQIVNSYNTDFDESGSVVLRDKKGEILRNKANSLEPFTLKELLINSLKDAIEESSQTGAGTKNPESKHITGVVPITSLSSVKTQVEADSFIKNHLMSLGKIRGTKDFQDAFDKYRAEYKVTDLPVS